MSYQLSKELKCLIYERLDSLPRMKTECQAIIVYFNCYSWNEKIMKEVREWKTSFLTFDIGRFKGVKIIGIYEDPLARRIVLFVDHIIKMSWKDWFIQ